MRRKNQAEAPARRRAATPRNRRQAHSLRKRRARINTHGTRYAWIFRTEKTSPCLRCHCCSTGLALGSIGYILYGEKAGAQRRTHSVPPGNRTSTPRWFKRRFALGSKWSAPCCNRCKRVLRGKRSMTSMQPCRPAPPKSSFRRCFKTCLWFPSRISPREEELSRIMLKLSAD